MGVRGPTPHGCGFPILTSALWCLLLLPYALVGRSSSVIFGFSKCGNKGLTIGVWVSGGQRLMAVVFQCSLRPCCVCCYCPMPWWSNLAQHYGVLIIVGLKGLILGAWLSGGQCIMATGFLWPRDGVALDPTVSCPGVVIRLCSRELG